MSGRLRRHRRIAGVTVNWNGLRVQAQDGVCLMKRPWIATIAVGAVVIAGLIAPATAQAAPMANQPAASVCDTANVSALLTNAQPGDLLAGPQDVTAQTGNQYGAFYRVLYATEAANGAVQASCALIALPQSPDLYGVVAWAHGTVGLLQSCQPSENPANFVGAMPAGIGVPTSGMNEANGALDNILQDGYAIVATDYPSQGIGSGLQPYALGVPEGLAVLNSARVLTHNAAAFDLNPIATNAELPLLTWGHSQGGGAAIWAGQLAQQYFTMKNDQTLNLVGVAGEAPATQFTTSPGQSANLNGDHLGDRDMYNFNPGLGVKFPIGVALFSYVMASWSQAANANGGPLPFGPTASVNYQDVLTNAGENTAPNVASDCLSGAGVISVYTATVKYLSPALYRFFSSPFAGTSSGPILNKTWSGGIDSTCANPSTYAQAVQDWCSWLQFNMPGPNGVNNYSKYPVDNDGNLVPMYLAQGRNDQIMWCVDNNNPVNASNCLTAQYYNSVDDTYCAADAYLNAQYFANVNHMQVPGAAATNPSNGNYQGSPLDQFITGAMNGTMPDLCNVATSKNPKNPKNQKK